MHPVRPIIEQWIEPPSLTPGASQPGTRPRKGRRTRHASCLSSRTGPAQCVTPTFQAATTHLGSLNHFPPLPRRLCPADFFDRSAYHQVTCNLRCAGCGRSHQQRPAARITSTTPCPPAPTSPSSHPQTGIEPRSSNLISHTACHEPLRAA